MIYNIIIASNWWHNEKTMIVRSNESEITTAVIFPHMYIKLYSSNTAMLVMANHQIGKVGCLGFMAHQPL